MGETTAGAGGSSIWQQGLKNGAWSGIVSTVGNIAEAGITGYYSSQVANIQNRTASIQMNSLAEIAGIESGLQSTLAGYQADAMRDQGQILRYQADMVRANKVIEDMRNRQALDQLGRYQSQQTAAYREAQGDNAAQNGAGNVDISSGSAAKVEEGNARRYASESAAIRRAYALQQWQGESSLAMMEAQAQGVELMSGAYDTMGKAYDFASKTYTDVGNIQSNAYRTIANINGGLQTSVFGNTLAAGLFGLGASIYSGNLTAAYDLYKDNRKQGAAMGVSEPSKVFYEMTP